MSRFEKKRIEIKNQIDKSYQELSILKKQLKTIIDKKHSYKRKEDSPALEKTVIEERNIQNKIDFHTNNISLLEDKLKQLDEEEKKSSETIIIMDKFLNQIKLGKTRPQASKSLNVSLSQIQMWYDDGKENKNPDSIYFYNNLCVIENFYLGFFDLLKREFKNKRQIALMSSFVPQSYPKRLDRYSNDDSKLWFSRLELRDKNELYYFGFKGESVPKLILTFSKNPDESNFHLIKDELAILIEIENSKELLKDFRIFKSNRGPNWYYLSLGRLNGGNLSKQFELLLTKYYRKYYFPEF